MLVLLVTALLAADPDPRRSVSEIACQTEAQCWMDADAKPIARPKKMKGKAFPRGDCGGRLLWLRNKVECQENVCVVRHVGDRC